MTRLFVLGLLAYIILLIGVAVLNGPLVGLAIPLVLFLLFGFLDAPPVPQLEVTRTISAERIAPGAPVTITVHIRNTGAPLTEALLEDPTFLDAEIAEGAPRRLVHLPAGGGLIWHYTVIARRGYYPLAPLRVTVRDQGGLRTQVREFPTAGQLFVLPPVSRLRRIAIRPRQTRVYSGSIPARQGGPGVEFFGVRAYAPGDSMRWLNWRVTARHPEALFANEFEQDRIADVGIILDARTRTNEFGHGHGLFEQATLAAATLSDAFLAAGNRVGLLVYGRFIQWTMPGYGKLQREKILQALARAQVGESQTFSNLIIPRRMFPTYSQMVIISTVQPEDVETIVRMHTSGYQVLTIVPDPISYELRYLIPSATVQLAARVVQLERTMLLHQLQRAGVQVVKWDVARPFEEVAAAVLSRPPAVMRALRAGTAS